MQVSEYFKNWPSKWLMWEEMHSTQLLCPKGTYNALVGSTECKHISLITWKLHRLPLIMTTTWMLPSIFVSLLCTLYWSKAIFSVLCTVTINPVLILILNLKCLSVPTKVVTWPAVLSLATTQKLLILRIWKSFSKIWNNSSIRTCIMGNEYK